MLPQLCWLQETSHKKYTWIQKKQYRHSTHPVDTDKNHYMRLTNNTPLTITSQVTDLTKSLSNNELKLLSLGPKFIMTQKLYDKLLLDIEINFYWTAYQLKWISKIQDESNTTTTTNTNSFPIYTLDHSIHPPPANKELNIKLSRLKRLIFSKHRKTQKNITKFVKFTATHSINDEK